MKSLVLSAIRIYQRFLNAGNPYIKSLLLVDSSCRFSPTCSEYMYSAIEKNGIIVGLRMGIKRILKCHPFSRGGFDPVP